MHIITDIYWLANHCHRLPLADRTTLNRGINRNFPWLLLRTDASGCHLTANLNHVVVNLVIVF